MFLGVTSELPMLARLTHSYTGAAVEIAAISARDGCWGIPSPLFWKWQSMSAVHPGCSLKKAWSSLLAMEP